LGIDIGGVPRRVSIGEYYVRAQVEIITEKDTMDYMGTVYADIIGAMAKGRAVALQQEPKACTFWQ
jgi:hypothetical protein